MTGEFRFQPLGALAAEILGAVKLRRVPIFQGRLDYILEREPADKVQKALFEIVRHVTAQQEFSKRYDDMVRRHAFPESETIEQTLVRIASEGEADAGPLLPFLSEVTIERSEMAAVADFAKRVGYSS
jgi:hypothetical protein